MSGFLAGCYLAEELANDDHYIDFEARCAFEHGTIAMPNGKTFKCVDAQGNVLVTWNSADLVMKVEK